MDASVLRIMKVSGSILLDKRGSFSHVHKHNISYAVDDFVSMVKEADACKDTLYYDSEEWELFYAYGYDPTNDYWKEFGSIAYEQLFISSNPLFKPIQIGEKDKFENKPMPRTLGGFMCVGCPKSDYIYDKSTIDKWHNQWFKDNPDEIDWINTNGIMPRRDIIIEILRQELIDCQNRIAPDGSNNLGLPHPKFLRLRDTNWKETNDDAIVSEHNEIIIRHQGGKIKAYSEKTGSLICSENYYNCETELSDLEKDHGNKKVSIIYSIKKDGKYQFISIDTAHGKFELCNDNGTHQGEIRFDGSSNGVETQDDSHSLQCVTEWKQKYKKK